MRRAYWWMSDAEILRRLRDPEVDKKACSARLDALNGPFMTQCMVRPCVARDFFVDLVGHGSCINVSGLSLERCSGPSWISARMRSH
jgi:hypothetical protein